MTTLAEDPNETDESRNVSSRSNDPSEAKTLFDRFGREDNVRMLVDKWFENTEGLKLDE